MKKLLTYLFITAAAFCITQAAFAAEPAVYEFENYEQTESKIKANEQASGGKYVQVSDRVKNTEYSVTIPIDVKEGEYILEYIASEESANSDNSAGPMYFQVDDGAEVKVTSANCTITAITPEYPSAVFKMSRIKYKNNLQLTEGKHTIKVILRANSDTEKTKGALDCMMLTKDGDDYPAVTNGELLLEAENVCNTKYIVDSEQASGGKACKIMYATEQTLEFKFTSEEDIEMNLELAAAEETFVGTYLSPIYFTLNDQDEVKINSSNTTKLSELFSIEFKVNELRYKTALNIKKGVNTITLRVPKRSTFNQDAAFCVIDCLSLRKVKSIGSLTSDIDSIVKRGDAISLAFKNQDGESISAMDLDSINVSFEDDYIGEFTGGTAYARNYGETTMNINATKGGNTFNISVPIEVVSETGLSIEQASRDKNKITLKLRANGNYAGGDRILIAAYNNKNGMLTSLIELASEDLAAANNGDVITVEKEVTSSDAQISVFIVSGSDSESAIYKKVVL